MPKRAADRRLALGALVADLAPIETPGEASDAGTADTRELPLDTLRPLPGQPRRSFGEAALADLVESVRARGVLTPLLVRPAPGGDGYEIVAGERRWRAATRAGLTRVPVVVRDLDDDDARTVALVENLQREDLNPVDRADATARLVADALGCAPGEVPARLAALRKRPDAAEHAQARGALEALFAVLGGSWRSFEANLLPVLRFPPEVLEAVRSGLEYTKGAVVARARDADERARLLALARGGASVDELRAALTAPPTARSGPGPTPEAEHAARVKRLGRRLGDWGKVQALPRARRERVERLLRELEAALGD